MVIICAGLTVEKAFNVDSENIVPAFLLGEVIERCAPGDARVIDEDVQFALAFLELCDERIAPGF